MADPSRRLKFMKRIRILSVLWTLICMLIAGSTSVRVTNQSQLDKFMNGTNVTDTHLTLAGNNTYVLDIVKLINIYKDSSRLIMESKGGPAEITCTASEPDPEKLKEVAQPISRVSLVQMDGLIFTGCPIPIMIEEVDNVTIQNCTFQ